MNIPLRSRKLPSLLSIPLLWAVTLAALLADDDADEEDLYADEPYWYQPGHPSNPADAASIETLPGFVAERVLEVPRELGSWTALCADPQGRLIAAAQHRPGLFRVTPAAADDPEGRTRVEELGGAARDLGWSQGLLYAFDSLYVTVAEENEQRPTGVYRLKDTDVDDEFDHVELLFELDGSGEHGPHNLVAAPDGSGLYLMCGNHTQPPQTELPDLPTATSGIDRLMPPGFDSSTHSTAGFVLRFNPDGSERQLVASGLRNCYDLAFNDEGELFTFDSDMEWDLGAPWYRPTRICHIVSGAEFGWRENGANWPEHFEDSVGPVLNIGPGSPTGLLFGYEAAFPEKYRNALFVCDWTFATIHAVHLIPEGGSYRGTSEEFLGGSGLPVTDMAIGSDGAMYFAVGGRKLGAALYRVRYVGEEAAQPRNPEERLRPLAALRRQLEEHHEEPEPAALGEIWSHLGHDDRSIRYAARVGLEKLPVELWQQRALQESEADTQLIALLALARQAPADQLDRVLDRCAQLDFTALDPWQTSVALRVCELALARFYGQDAAEHAAIREALRPIFPHPSPEVNRELVRLRAYLGDPELIAPALEAMANDSGERSSQGLRYYSRNPKYGQAIRDMLDSAPLVDRMHHAQMLLWVAHGWSLPQRLEYFHLIGDAMRNSKGGHWYQEFWTQIRERALARLDEDTREAVATRIAQAPSPDATGELPSPIGPGRAWTVDSALEAFAANREPRDLEAGERTYAATSCITCHRLGSEGGSIGPDLSSLGQRFTPRDILDAIVNPDKAVSDQYRMAVVTLQSGETLTGRILSRDETQVRLATNLLRPNQSVAVSREDIVSEEMLPVSTMPRGLLDPINEDELLDLLAYLISGGDSSHSLYQRPADSP